jgi:hypothetical protein
MFYSVIAVALAVAAVFGASCNATGIYNPLKSESFATAEFIASRPFNTTSPEGTIISYHVRGGSITGQFDGTLAGNLTAGYEREMFDASGNIFSVRQWKWIYYVQLY